MLETKKIRLYIKDQIVPHPARKARMVVDFLTDENILKFPLEKEKIEDLTIFGVNRDWEIPFLEEKDQLIINLGNLDQWIGIKDEKGLKPVKLDLSFILVEPGFQRSRLDLGYWGSFDFPLAEELELHITLPLGMKMHKEGKNPEIHFTKEIKNSFREGKDKTKIISISASNILEKDRKRRYDFLLRKEQLLDIYQKLNIPKTVEISYNAVNERQYYLISFIGLGLFFLAIFRLIKLIFGELEFDIRYLAALVAFIGLFLTISRENYEIPLRKLIIFSTVFLAVELILELTLLK